MDTPKRKPGRPPAQEVRKLRSIRMTDSEWEQFKKAGGTKEVRALLRDIYAPQEDKKP